MVLLQAPLRLRLDEENRLTLLSGSLSAHVPLPARGFTVDTKSARLVDLGTRFGAKVEPPRATIVRVTEGLGIGDSDTSLSGIKFNGLLDDVAMWSVPLSPEQILFQYQNGPGRSE